MKEFDTITKCRICGLGDFKYSYEIKINNNLTANKLELNNIPTIWLCKCKKCGFAFSNPQVSDLLLNAYYINNSIFYDKGVDLQIDKISRENKKLIKYIINIKESGNILEIGCGFGFLLNEFDINLWNRFGVEPAPYAYDYARNKFGLNVNNGYFRSDHYEDNFFDVIVLIDVLEHLKDPLEMIQNLYPKLKKDGFLLLVTGNINSINAKISRGYWEYLKTWEHISLFSPKSIHVLLNNVGFTTINIHKVSHHGEIIGNFFAFVKCHFKNLIKLFIRPIRKYELHFPLLMDHMIITAIK